MHNYDILELVHKSRYSIIHKVRHKQDYNVYAMKEYLGFYNQALSEIRLHKQVQIPFVTKIKEVFQLDENLVMVYEYCDQGTLRQFIEQHMGNTITERVICKVMMQIVFVFTYMRENKMIYKGLTPDNILLNQDQIRINDFGIDNLVTLPQPRYQVPEFIMEKKFSYRSMMYQMGLILYEMMSQRYLVNADNVEKMLIQIQNGGLIVNLPQIYSKHLRFLLHSCLEIRESDRLDIRQLTQNESFKTLFNQRHFQFTYEQLQFFEFWSSHKSTKQKRASIITQNFELSTTQQNRTSRVSKIDINTAQQKKIPQLLLQKTFTSRPTTQQESRAQVTLSRSNFKKQISLTSHRKIASPPNPVDLFIPKTKYLKNPEKPIGPIQQLIKQKLEQCVETVGVEETRMTLRRLRSGGSVKEFLNNQTFG